MKNLAVVFLFASLSVHAKVYLDSETGHALAYQTSGDRVNALLCTSLTAGELSKDFDGALREHCKPMTESGLTLADVERNLPKYQAQQISALEKDTDSIRDIVIAEGSPPDQVDAKVKQELDNRRSDILALQAADIFRMFQVEGALPLMDEVDADDVDSEIAQVTLFGAKE